MFAILGFDFEMAQHEFGPVDWRITCKNSQKLLFTYFLFIFCVLFDVQLRE
jgi:leucyl-tRNA synthetase